MEISSVFEDNCSCYCKNCHCPSCTKAQTPKSIETKMVGKGVDLITMAEYHEIKKGRFISAIKMIRGRTGMFLKDAKKLTDKFR